MWLFRLLARCGGEFFFLILSFFLSFFFVSGAILRHVERRAGWSGAVWRGVEFCSVRYGQLHEL